MKQHRSSRKILSYHATATVYGHFCNPSIQHSALVTAPLQRWGWGSGTPMHPGDTGVRHVPPPGLHPGRRPTSYSSFRNSRGHHTWEHSNPPLVGYFKKGNLKVHLARGTGRRSKSCTPQLLLKPPLQVFLCLFCSETPLLHLALSNSALISLYLFHNGLNN